MLNKELLSQIVPRFKQKSCVDTIKSLIFCVNETLVAMVDPFMA